LFRHNEYREYDFITKGFQDQTDLNTQELEEKIWKYAESWIGKSKLYSHVGGDKKTCFDRIELMIPTQLKKRTVKNRIEVVRIDMTRRAEFESALDFHKDELKRFRDYLWKIPKPMFYEGNSIIHYIPAVAKHNIKEFRKAYKKNMKNPKGFKFDEEIKIWKTRKPNVVKSLENLRFYYTGIMVLISRSLMQKSLGIISTKEANIRVKKCEKVLEHHFKTMFAQNNLNDREAIKQNHEYGYLFQNSVYDLGKFRI